MLAYCQPDGITFTRSRPYKKNESAHVEQKNGAIVRQVVGYDRYDSKVAFAQLARVDRLVRLHANFFRPVQKLVAKSRNGARTHRRYDVARPPYQRLCDAAVLTVENRKELERQYRNLNPLRLRREIDAELARLWQMSTPTISLEPDRGTGNAKLAQAMAAEKMVADTDAHQAVSGDDRGIRASMRDGLGAQLTDIVSWPVRVLVVEDNALMRAATAARLRNEPDIHVTGVASDRDQALLRMEQQTADIVLMDLRLGNSAQGGAELAAEIGTRFPAVEIVVYSGYVADPNLAIPGASNVKGCVLKTDPPRAVVEAIRAVARGGRYPVPRPPMSGPSAIR